MPAEGPTCADEAAGADVRNRLLVGLYREYSVELHRFLLGLLRDRGEADDALQQVFLKLLEAWDAVEPQTVRGWLYTVGYHEALARRRRRQIDEAALNRLWSRPVWQSGAKSADPVESFRQSQESELVRRAIGDLPEAQREVVERRIYRDQTFATIAQEIGCPLNTVLSRMRLAVEKLQRLLEDPA
jgi:RNA polymerase sigma-70 factor (ECF subfamily)